LTSYNYGNLPNLIKKQKPIWKGKRRNIRKGPTSNQETTPKNTNRPTRVTKEDNGDLPEAENDGVSMQPSSYLQYLQTTAFS